MRSAWLVYFVLVGSALGCSNESSPSGRGTRGSDPIQIRAMDAPLRLGKFVAEDSALGLCEIELYDYSIQEPNATFAVKATKGCDVRVTSLATDDEPVRFRSGSSYDKHHLWDGYQGSFKLQIDIRDEDHLFLISPQIGSSINKGTYFYRVDKTQSFGEQPVEGFINLCRFGRIASAVAYSFGDISCSNISKEKVVASKTLSLINVNLEEIPAEFLGQFTNLESLDLRLNQIKKIDERGLQGLEKLKTLSFAENQISEIPTGLFAGLKRLSVINFRANNISEIKRGVFPEVQLTELNLDSNSISRIEDGAFADVYVSNVVHLSNNKLTQLRAGMLKGFRSVKAINLANNLISQIDPKVGEDLFLVRDLNLNNNLLTVIPSGQFQFFNFHSLSLMNNQVAVIEDLGLQRNSGTPSGGNLFLGGNPIKRIDKWKSGAGTFEVIVGVEAD